MHDFEQRQQELSETNVHLTSSLNLLHTHVIVS